MHAFSDCDMISYPYAKAKIIALNTFPTDMTISKDYALREVEATQADPSKSAKPFLHHTARSSTLDTRFTIFNKNNRSPKIKALLQHHPVCSCTRCGPICRSRCRKRQTSKPHLTGQPISLSSTSRSVMPS